MKPHKFLRLPFVIATGLLLAGFAQAIFADARAPQPGAERKSILDGLRLPAIAFTPPAVNRENLANGARLYTAGDASLPFITLSLHFRGGTLTEEMGGMQTGTNSSNSPGSLQALLALLESGGAGTQNGDELARELGAMGAQLKFQSGYEYWSVQLVVLKRDFDRGFEILSEVLLNPRLPADRLQIVKNGMLAAIQRRNDDPSRLAARKLNEVLYAGTRRGYSLRADDVNAITPELLRRELNRRLQAESLYATASGDLAGLNLIERLNRVVTRFPGTAISSARSSVANLSSLRNANAGQTTVGTGYAVVGSAPASQQLRGRILLVNKPAAQAVVQIAGRLPARRSGDMYALQTGNYILGGGSFNSRLTREIRVQRGLAYYAYSYNQFDAGGGRFVAGSGTRSFLAHKTLGLMYATIVSMQTDVSAGDLQLAKDAILNSLAFQFDSPEDAVFQAVRNDLHGMPADYLAGFPGKVRGLSAGELSAVARRYQQPQNLWTVIVGPAALKEKLEALRPVVVIEPEDTIESIRIARLGAARADARN